MKQRRTQIDKAIEQLESDLHAKVVTFEAERAGLMTAIGRLREQAAKPKRKAPTKPVAVPA